VAGWIAALVFVLIALGAVGFVAWPILAYGRAPGRVLLAAAAVLFVIGLSGGLYLYLGRPMLAERALNGANDRSLNGLIGRLAAAVRKHPADPRAWALLGQSYMTARDPTDAASAFARAIEAARAQGLRYSFLYSAYGEALTGAAAGAVPPEAEDAFGQALALDRKDMAARYFLGLAAAAHGNTTQALAFWNDLLGDVPPSSALHADLVDRIAVLTARSGGDAPNIAAMVEGLAARLKAKPDDAVGWQKLIRAYAVLGDKDKARAALTDAHKAAAGRGDVIAALNAEQKALGL